MSSARRFALNVYTAVKQQQRGIGITSVVKQWSTNKSPSIHCNKNRHLSTNTHIHDLGFTDVADLLSTPERDFLVGSHGQKVPVSSLKGKLVGLYVCEVMPQPPRLEAIKKVYEEAEWRGYDFEIVQITFDFNTTHHNAAKPVALAYQFRYDLLWLSLPFMDQSLTKIQRIFQNEAGGQETDWQGDSLVLIHPPDASGDLHFEFSGAEILQRWGIEGYPFTRGCLYKAEYEVQKREVTLQRIFRRGERLRRPREGLDLVDAHSQLSGKRVLVVLADHSLGRKGIKFLSMLKSEYEAQQEDNVAGESKFEVVYVSTGFGVSSFDEFTKDMPWLVQPYPSEVDWHRFMKVFKPTPRGTAAVAFNEQGELIAKEDRLDGMEGDRLQFPFIDQDLGKRIRLEVEELCG